MGDKEKWVIGIKEGHNKDEKFFSFDNLKKDKRAEEQIPFFTKIIEGMGLEIFKIEGHQLMTENGVYTILPLSLIEAHEK